MSDLLKSIEESISARRLLARGQKILVAVSGGVDSMVLLDVLQQLSSKHSWRITVAHLNHQLRGRSSHADERLVRRAVEKLGLPFVSECVEVRKLAKAEKLSIEMAARKARHEFLARTAQRLKIRTIALAHQADDQLELFFLRLLRGSGSDGLAGIKWCSPSPRLVRIELIRPMLDQAKAALLNYAAECKIRFREDATNASLDFQRNRIRHELLPLLRLRYQPALDRSIARVMEILGAEAEFLNGLALEWSEGKAPRKYKEMPVALQRRCLQLQLFQLGVAAEFDVIERLRTNSNQPLMIAPDRSVIRDEAGKLVLRKGTAAFPDETQLEINLAGRGGELLFDGLQLSWRLTKTNPSQPPPKPLAGREIFDADKVGSTVVLRHWFPGDRFQPIGLSRPKKLQDLFTNGKIPSEQRHRLVVATTQTGELFWVEKLRISERFKVSSQTIHRLLWRWKPR